MRTCAATLACARSTVRRWWNWLKQRHELFAFYCLTDKPHWGRSATWQSFWQLALDNEPLAELMASLDQRGVVVP